MNIRELHTMYSPFSRITTYNGSTASDIIWLEKGTSFHLNMLSAKLT